MSSKTTVMTKHGVILKVTGTANYQFAGDIKLQSVLEGRPLRLSASLPGGGGGVRGTHQSFIRGGSGPRSKPLPFYIPFLVEKVPLSYTFHRKLYPSHITKLFTSETPQADSSEIKVDERFFENFV